MQNFPESIKNLDLEPIMVKIMEKEEGLGWDLEYTSIIAEEYRKFLTLCLENKDADIVPCGDVDKFWHYHILDTLKYAEDCDAIFGCFLHHFPYFGMRGEQDLQNLKTAFGNTCAAYTKRFGEPTNLIKNDAWQTIARCPNCGRRSPANSDSYQMERPKLKKIAA